MKTTPKETWLTKLPGYFAVPHELLHVWGYRLVGRDCHYDLGQTYVITSTTSSAQGMPLGRALSMGYVNDWGWYKSARLGNACGVIVVTQHGCANFMPTYDEVTKFVEERGGF